MWGPPLCVWGCARDWVPAPCGICYPVERQILNNTFHNEPSNSIWDETQRAEAHATSQTCSWGSCFVFSVHFFFFFIFSFARMLSCRKNKAATLGIFPPKMTKQAFMTSLRENVWSRKRQGKYTQDLFLSVLSFPEIFASSLSKLWIYSLQDQNTGTWDGSFHGGRAGTIHLCGFVEIYSRGQMAVPLVSEWNWKLVGPLLHSKTFRSPGVQFTYGSRATGPPLCIEEERTRCHCPTGPHGVSVEEQFRADQQPKLDHIRLDGIGCRVSVLCSSWTLWAISSRSLPHFHEYSRNQPYVVWKSAPSAHPDLWLSQVARLNGLFPKEVILFWVDVPQDPGIGVSTPTPSISPAFCRTLEPWYFPELIVCTKKLTALVKPLVGTNFHSPLADYSRSPIFWWNKWRREVRPLV